jgi:3-oxoacyl-[acyl-carrier protein] reductase
MMDRNRDFEGKAGIITGAASGIGAAAAEVLAARGAQVIMADINEEMLKEKSIAISESGGQVMGVQTDVSRENQVDALVDSTLDAYGKIDFLVNSAAILARTSFMDLAPKEWDHHMNINLRGSYLTCNKISPHMASQGKGAIVNVSSGAGRSASITGGAHYTVSKAGLIGLGRHLAKELGPKGIRVNIVCPGVTLTPMADEFIDSERQARIASRVPLGRLAEPIEPAFAIAFLLSDEASYINGVCLDVNGGRQMY